MEKVTIINRMMDKIFKYSGLKYLYFKNKKNKDKCPIFLYHSLNPKIAGVSQDLFEKHIKYLSSNYKIVTLKETLQKIANNRLDGNELVITFDDGYEDNINKAYPILKKYKATATIFIATQLINRRYLGQKMMNKNQIIELAKNGIEIGSHTVTHPKLTDITKDQLKIELLQSKIELENIIGDEVTSFAYPGGIYNETVIDMCKKTGYKAGCTLFHDFYIEHKKTYEIPRMIIYPYDSVKDIKAKLNGDRHWKIPFYKLSYPYKWEPPEYQ